MRKMKLFLAGAALALLPLMMPAGKTLAKEQAKAGNDDTVGAIVEEVETIGGGNLDTVITLEDGTTAEVDNAVLAVSLEEINSAAPDSVGIESYEVVYEEQTILLVEPDQLAGLGIQKKENGFGYYSVTFAIPGTNKEVFLTGLTADSVDSICKSLINGYQTGEDFVLESLDIIDAEKLMDDDGIDDYLCWAATASNIIHYTGWGKKAGFEDEDEIFSYFVENFIDDGFVTEDGVSWFFSGTTGDKDGNNSRLKNYPGSGGLLKGYNYTDACEYVNVDHEWKYAMPKMLDSLKNGCGVGLGITWDVEYASIGHAITLWGMVIDKDQAPDKKEHWAGLIVTDSDTSRPKADTDNRRLQLNTFEVYKLTPYEDDDLNTFKFYEDEAFLDSFVPLKPCDGSVAFESDEAATLDIHTTADLFCSNLFLSNNIERFTDYYECMNGDCYIWPEIKNNGDVDVNGEIILTGCIKDSTGNVVMTIDTSEKAEIKALDKYYAKAVHIGKLAPGTYTAELTVNPDHTIPEAYYVNNTYVRSFTVLDSKTDISALKFSAKLLDADEFGSYEVSLDYNGFEDTQFFEDCDAYYIEASMYKDGKWSDYSTDYVEFPEDLGDEELPDKITVKQLGSKVRFRLDIDMSLATLELFSEELEFPYTGFTALATEANAEDIKEALEADDTALPEGKWFAFKIKNATNTDIPELTGKYRVVAYDNDGAEVVLLENTEIALKKGEESEEIRVNTIKHDKPLSGSYSVYAIIDSDHEGASESNYTLLGSFFAQEQASAHVTTPIDEVDEFDGKTSIREAIDYCYGHPGSRITFEFGVNEIELETPIVIEGNVDIYGCRHMEDGSNSFVSFKGQGKKGLFVVNAGGSLSLDSVILADAIAEQEGGSVDVKGGRLTMVNCSIRNSVSGFKGGAICVDDGKLLLKNVSITEATSGYGGAIYMNAGTEAELLNCAITACKSNMATIYNNFGKLNVINSVVSGNHDLGFSGKNVAIRGAGDTNIINSAVINGDKEDITGSVNVYASAVGGISNEVNADELTTDYELEKIFNLNQQNRSVLMNEISGLAFEVPSMRGTAAEGFYTSVSNGIVYISKDGKQKVSTGVKTSFTDSELSADMLGAKRNAVYGCCTTIVKNIADLKYEKIAPQVYTGKVINPSVVIKDGDKTLELDKDYSIIGTPDSKLGTHTMWAVGMGEYAGSITFEYEVIKASVRYRAYVQKKGWMSYVKDGAMAGAKENLRMETIQMKLTGTGKCTGGLKYRAYVQKLGWTFWADTAISDSYAGTKGKALRLEAIQLKGYGDIASAYDVYYRVYCDKYGWLDWAKNGASAGTSGLAKKLQAFQVKLVAKGGKAPGKTAKPYATNKNP